MTALLAIGKYLLKAFATDPKGVLKVLGLVIMIPLVLLCLLIVAPLALFTHVPLIEEEQGIYQDVVKEIQSETGVLINVDELVGIDAVLLKQEFNNTNESHVRDIAWEFIDERQETRTRTVTVECPKDKDGKPSADICEEEEEYSVTVYSLIPFDTVLSNLVAKGVIKTDWILDIKRYASGSSQNETKIDMENLPEVTDGTFMRPATGRITSGRGWRWGRMHQGVDIGGGGRTGVPIVASADGIVSKSQIFFGLGECIMIEHNVNGQLITTLYGHMVSGSRQVSVGERVTKGQVIGILGNTGNSTGPHLHFEFHTGPYLKGSPHAVDPMRYVQF